MTILHVTPDKRDKKSILKKRLLKNIFKGIRLSIKDLHQQNDSSLPTITAALNELIQSGLVLPFGAATETGGRNAHLYRISPGGAFVVGVWIENNTISIGSYKLDLSEAHPIVTRSISSMAELPQIMEQYLAPKPHLSSKLIGIGFSASAEDMETLEASLDEINILIDSKKTKHITTITQWNYVITQSLINLPNSNYDCQSLLSIRMTDKPRLGFIFDRKMIESSDKKTGIICGNDADFQTISELLTPIINATGVNEIVISGEDNKLISSLAEHITKLDLNIIIKTVVEDSRLQTQSAALTVLNRSFINY